MKNPTIQDCERFYPLGPSIVQAFESATSTQPGKEAEPVLSGVEREQIWEAFIELLPCRGNACLEDFAEGLVESYKRVFWGT